MTQLLVGVRVFLGSSSGPARLQPLIEVILSGKRIYPAREWFRARSWHSRPIESLVRGRTLYKFGSRKEQEQGKV